MSNRYCPNCGSLELIQETPQEVHLYYIRCTACQKYTYVLKEETWEEWFDNNVAAEPLELPVVLAQLPDDFPP